MNARAKNPLPYPLVLIEWIDACGFGSWTQPEEIEDWMKDENSWTVNEVGWLITTTPRFILLCPQVGKDGVMGNLMKIPRPWVKMTVLLKKGGPR